MIVHDLDVDRSRRALRPLKANPPLVIDADAVLALTVAVQSFQTVARYRRQIVQALGRLQTVQPAFGLPREARKLLDPIAPCESLGFLIAITHDHMCDLIRNYALRKA